MKLDSTVSFPADHPAFAGHFPGFPIVPGVMLLDEIVHLQEATSGSTVTGIPSAKFLRPVAPAQAVTLSCAMDTGRQKFEIVSATEVVVTGQLAIEQRK